MSDKENLIQVPASLIRECSGLSIDFGSTLCKIIYRSKENLEEAKTKTNPSDLAHLQILSLKDTEWEQKLDDVKKLAILSDRGPARIIKTTGQGCTKHAKIIEDTLSIHLEQKTEFDCFVKAFNYLVGSLGRSNLLEPFDLSSIDDVVKANIEQMKAMQLINDLNVTGDEKDKEIFEVILEKMKQNPFAFLKSISGLKEGKMQCDDPLVTAEHVYPCLLAVCGSGAGSFRINEDKSFRLLEVSNRGGRALQGLSCLLLSCKSHDEFLELASRGNTASLDFNVSDFYSGMPQNDGTMYTVNMDDAPSDLLIFCFGKVMHGKTLGDYKREDVARALLNYFILDFVQTTILTCHAYNLARVFLTGSFFKHPFVRLIFTKEMARKNISNFFFSGGEKKPIDFDFVKYGGHLGALGAMIS